MNGFDPYDAQPRTEPSGSNPYTLPFQSGFTKYSKMSAESYYISIIVILTICIIAMVMFGSKVIFNKSAAITISIVLVFLSIYRFAGLYVLTPSGMVYSSLSREQQNEFEAASILGSLMDLSAKQNFSNRAVGRGEEKKRI